MGFFQELFAALTNTGQAAQSAAVASVRRVPASAPPAVTYRSRDGSSYFRFRFTPRPSDVRIHIVDFPNPHIGSCHVLHDNHGPYICWSRGVPSMAAAKAVALMWAEATLVYQRTGRTF